MVFDSRLNAPHRGGRLLEAIRRAEAGFEQRTMPQANPPAPLGPLPLVVPIRAAEHSPNAIAPELHDDPYAGTTVPLRPATTAAPSSADEPRPAPPPRFKLNLPNWPEIEELAHSILGDFPELVSAVIACASIDRASGSSLVAGPLARALAARPGSEVLLVEADFYASLRTPATLHQPKPGLAEVFADELAWSDVVVPTAIARLGYLPAGLAARSISIDASAAGRLWSDLKRRYKYIVVDAGPAREALAAGWLATCDEVYLAVELGRTGTRRARDVARSIVAAGGRVRGAVAIYAGI